MFRKALKIGPDRADAHVGLARVSLYLYALGLDESPERLASALKESRRAVDLAPDDPAAAAALALALAAGDRLSPALEESRRAVSLDPASPEAHVALCIVLRLRKDENGALDACRRAAEIAPHDPRVLSALGEALRETELYEKALEMFGQAVDMDHEAIVPRDLYNLLLKKWDYGESRARLGAAALLVATQDYQGALDLYGGVEVPEGTSMPALLILYAKGYCLKRLGRDAEAEYFLSSFLDRVPPDYDGPARGRELLFNAYDDLIAYFRSKGRDRKVIALLRSACDRPLVPTRLARALADELDARKEVGESAAVLEKAILGADSLEDPLEIAESTLKLVRLRTSNGARRLPDDSPAARALALTSERLRPSAPGAAHYRLARALSLAQRRDLALQRLLQARAAGYLPADQMAGEPDFERIREDPGFEALLKQQTP
ncbi:MAG: hypothetical protein AUI52_03390 [Acidobacteria bacterium 13_1_40CM_2_68_10]|nr:MAG: hypothetical protein AUI52_03390 [Acidobacteria bacterium 13_1_40CM_2_68_10]